MKLKIVTTLAIAGFVVGCSTSPLSVDLEPGAQNIIVKDIKPTGAYEVIAPVSVSNGKGCRDFGYLGTREEAMKELKNKTKEINGEYAQITAVTKPHLDGGCFKNEYTIMALVYKKGTPKAVQLPEINSEEEVFTKKLRELKSMLSDGVLTQTEYDAQKAKLLDQGFNTK